MDKALITPCGGNCNICKSYLRKYKKCLGCYEDERKILGCFFHKCEIIKTSKARFCIECEQYPCATLEKLDKKHRERDGMSMIANLEHIREHGLAAFIEAEEEKWKCPECGGVICVGAWSIACSACGLEIKRIIKEGKKYRLLQVWPESKEYNK